jgi:hypothetical protein
MELSLQTRMENILLRIRLVFWRTVSACIAALMRTPPALHPLLKSLPLLIFGALAYVLGRAAGNLLTDILK